MHNIFGNRFYSYRQPAWHGLGRVSDTETSATEAFIPMQYDVEIRDVTIPGVQEVPIRALVRTALPDDPRDRYFGTVGPEYQLVSPLKTVEIWDASVGKAVETIGVLGRGEMLFMTTKLPTIDVGGDEVDNYLLFTSPYTGGEAIEARITPVRVVCQNTLIAARHASTMSLKIVHDDKVEQRVASWLKHLYASAEQRANTLREFFVAMTRKQVNSGELEWALNEVYPEPKEPVANAPEDVMALRQANWATNKQYAQRYREAVTELFLGKARGADTVAAKGTAWGFYNAVTEWEDYRPDGGKLAARQVGALFGYRAQAKEKAFTAAVSMARRP